MKLYYYFIPILVSMFALALLLIGSLNVYTIQPYNNDFTVEQLRDQGKLYPYEVKGSHK